MRSTAATVTEPCAAQAPFVTTPTFRLNAPEGEFVATERTPMISSKRKLVYRGTWEERDRPGNGKSAVAIVFIDGDVALYGTEVAAISRNGLLGVGPVSYLVAASVPIGGSLRPVIIEEDAGVSLDEAVFGHVPVPFCPKKASDRTLCPMGTSERERENAKILFDIYTQVKSLHDAGFFHRDIRLANVCVRRFGNRPQDIRAFLVDHELATTYRGKDVPASAQSYEHALFCKLPRLARKTTLEQSDPESPEGQSNAPAPTSLMRDLGYLAALKIELETERSISQASPNDFASVPRSFFRYAENGNPVVHTLSHADDIEPLAQKALLTPVDIDHFFNPTSLEFARAHLKHGGYADARDLATLAEQAPIVQEGIVERIAREAVYPKWFALCRELGREPEYPDFDSQPQNLQESNRAQVRDIARKIGALGYRIVPENEARREEVVETFSEEEIDYLAYLEHQRWMDERLAEGWTWGQTRNDAAREHPDLIPYDNLSAKTREYDRSAAREIPALLAEAGLVICR